jgi:hypothetical protein
MQQAEPGFSWFDLPSQPVHSHKRHVTRQGNVQHKIGRLRGETLSLADMVFPNITYFKANHYQHTSVYVNAFFINPYT